MTLEKSIRRAPAGPAGIPVGKCRPAGFTMVEVLIAAAVGVVLMGALYDVFYTGNRINRDTQNRADALQAATVTLSRVQQDLKQLVTLPVRRDGEGKIDNRWGDHQVPVRISPMGRNLTFYVPDGAEGRGNLPKPGAVAVSYSLEPSTDGLFHVKRTEHRSEEFDAAEGRVLTTVNVRDLKFRLLDPLAGANEDRSPDQNFYVETIVTAADATGRETMTMAALTQLEHPSIFAQANNKRVNESLAFSPRAPLPGVPDARSYTEEEFQSLESLRDLVDRFDRGEVPPEKLEEQVRRVVQNADRQPPGRQDLVATRGPASPLGDSPLTLQPPRPGSPLEFQTPGGDSILVPRNPQETTNRLIEEIARGGPGGSGTIRIVMTDTFQEFRPGSSGTLRETDAQGRRREGRVDFDSDAGQDFSAIHRDAVESFRTPTGRFFEDFGLPPPR